MTARVPSLVNEAMFICLFGVDDTGASLGNCCRPPRTTRRNSACLSVQWPGLLNYVSTEDCDSSWLARGVPGRYAAVLIGRSSLFLAVDAEYFPCIGATRGLDLQTSCLYLCSPIEYSGRWFRDGSRRIRVQSSRFSNHRDDRRVDFAKLYSDGVSMDEYGYLFAVYFLVTFRWKITTKT